MKTRKKTRIATVIAVLFAVSAFGFNAFAAAPTGFIGESPTWTVNQDGSITSITKSVGSVFYGVDDEGMYSVLDPYDFTLELKMSAPDSTVDFAAVDILSDVNAGLLSGLCFEINANEMKFLDFTDGGADKITSAPTVPIKTGSEFNDVKFEYTAADGKVKLTVNGEVIADGVTIKNLNANGGWIWIGGHFDEALDTNPAVTFKDFRLIVDDDGVKTEYALLGAEPTLPEPTTADTTEPTGTATTTAATTTGSVTASASASSSANAGSNPSTSASMPMSIVVVFAVSLLAMGIWLVTNRKKAK